MSTYHVPEPEKKFNPFLPMLGLILAIMIGVVAYFAAPIVVDLLEKNVDQFATRLQEEPERKDQVTIGIGAFIWIAFFGLAMTIVMAAKPRDIVDEEYANLKPRDLTDPKAVQRYEKKFAKNRRDKIKAVKRIKKQRERQGRG
jgi:hypothetical protein